MASPWAAKGSVQISDSTGSSITIHVDETPGLSAKSLSFSTWEAAFVLSDILHKIKLPLSDSNTKKAFDILELGAGTGLVGIAAAAIWKRNTVLTDLPSLLPGLAANVEVNRDLLDRTELSVTCGSLDWNAPDSLHIANAAQSMSPDDSSRPSVILAADTLYDPDHAPLMANTISTWLATGPESRAILCYALRFAYIDCIREFWDPMEAKGLQCVQEGRAMAREEWNEVPGTEFEWCVWRWRDHEREA